MTKRKTKLPARYRQGSSNPTPSTRLSSREATAPPPRQQDPRGRYGSTLSPAPINIPLNDTVSAHPAATNTPTLRDCPTPKTPARKRSATPTSRRGTTKKRKTPGRDVDDNYVSTPPRRCPPSTRHKRTKIVEPEVEQGGVGSDDSLEAYLQHLSEDEGDSPQLLSSAQRLLNTISAGSSANVSGLGEIQLDVDWFANEEPPPLHPGRARLLKDWELKQYIRRTDETRAKITKLLTDTQWLEDVEASNRDENTNSPTVEMDSKDNPGAPEELLKVAAHLPSSVISTSENTYLSPLPTNIARTASPTIASLRASGGGLLGKATSSSSAAVRWVMQSRVTRITTATTPKIAPHASSRAPSPLPSPPSSLKLDSQYHASIGTATPRNPPSPTTCYPEALRTGNDYSNPRGFPHTPPRVSLDFHLPVSTAITSQPGPRSAPRRL